MRRSRLPLFFWIATALLVTFGILCVWLIWSTSVIREKLEASVDGVTAALELRRQIEEHAASGHALPAADVERARERIGRAHKGIALTGAAGVDAELARAGAAAERLAVEEPPAVAAENKAEALTAVDRVVAALRARSREISVVLGRQWHFLDVVAVGAVLLSVSNVLLMVSAWKQRRLAEAGQAELNVQLATLRSVTERWATGDLEAPLPAASAEPDAFARALDDLRTKLLAKIEEARHKGETIDELDFELRHQLHERSLALAVDLSFHLIREAREPRRGDVLAGRYTVEEKMGEGGMGDVWRVRRAGDGRTLALKVLRRVDDERRRLRFLREAALLTKVRHPNVIAIVDLGVSPGGFPYLVTEIGAGKTLDSARSALDEESALPVLKAIAEGLAAIHAKGVVHRDLKPANVLVSEVAGGQVTIKIIDFGLAKIFEGDDGDTPSKDKGSSQDESSSQDKAPSQDKDSSQDEGSSPGRSSLGSLEATEEGAIVGTPHYIAPELVRGQPATPAADIFAFGVTAYRVLAAAMPFATPLSDSILRRRPVTAPVPLAERCPRLSPPIAALLMSCLAQDPEARPTAEDLARRL